MTLPIGTEIRSRRNGKTGIIVGYGSLCWPTSDQMSGDGGVQQPVYLVQIAQGSSSLGPACAVYHAEQVEVV